MHCLTRSILLSNRSAVRSVFRSATRPANSSARQISIITTQKISKKIVKNNSDLLGSSFGIYVQRRPVSSQQESNKNDQSGQTNSDDNAKHNSNHKYGNFEEEYNRQQEEIRKLKEELESIHRRRQQFRAQRKKVWLILIVFFAAANVLLYLVSTSVPTQHTGGNLPVGHALDQALLERLNGKWIEAGANNIKTKEEVAISMLEFDLKSHEQNFIQSQKSSRSGAELSRSQSNLVITSSSSAPKTDVLVNNNAVPELATKITAVAQQNKEFVLAGDELIFNNKKYTKLNN